MTPFRFRGRDVIAGALRLPDGAALVALHVGGWFHDLFGPSLPAAPETVDYLAANPAAQATMLGNDVVGCCGWSADLHLAASRSANAGQLWTPTTDEAIAGYTSTGYVVGDPSTDKGTVPSQLLAYRRTHPYPDSSVLTGSAPIDATDATKLRQGLWLATGALAWACLPDAWESDEDAGAVWDVAGPPVPRHGHAFALLDYTAIGPRIVTWGEIVQLTWAAAARYLTPTAGGGVVALLDVDAVSTITGRTPSGYDLSGLTRLVGGLAA